MKLIIDVDKDYYEMLKYNVEHGQDYKPFEIIAKGILYEEKPFEINVFLENADESTLFDIKKELARILTDRAEREAYEEARREAMRLDDNEDTYKWRGHA